MDPEIKAFILENLPGAQWEDITYTPMGNFAQVLYKGKLAGYVMLESPLVFKPKGLWKG